MLAGVKSQVASSMSGWLSGGIPGLNRAGAGAEGETNAAMDLTDSTRDSAATAVDITSENVKDDDASRWVAGYVTMQQHAAPRDDYKTNER